MSGTIIMEDPQISVTEKQPLKTKYEPSGLQVKLQKQRDRVRNSQHRNSPITNGPKKSSLMSAARMQIPRSSGGYQRLDNSPLVTLESDSEDEIFLSYNRSSSARQVNKEMSQQLAKDGYQLDEVPDDEDLDLIPPSDFRRPNHCECCGLYNSCIIS
uniref:Protein FAM219A-like n=1 Tax=Phallusia mammillata TaxID=59560 RepID=A0A6F9DD13_9ASCI|nr:protein FAM219A-like [Phallusia mammillata]